MNLHKNTSISTRISIFYTILISILIPNFQSYSYVNTNIDKMFLFFYSLSFFLLIKIAISVFKKHQNISLKLSLTLLDIILLIYFVYILINGYIQNINITFRFFELLGLAVFYIILKNISNRLFTYIFAAVILGGLFQSLYANMQLWNIIPSNNAMFKVTGTYMNPGPLGGYLATTLSLLLGTYLLKYSNNTQTNYNRYFNIIMKTVILLFSLALIASKSRAAYISVFAALFCFIPIRYKFFRNPRVIALILFVLISITIGLLFHNINSVNGRFFIWQISTRIFCENIWFGIGFDQFPQYYMLEQGEYFQAHINSNNLYVADDNKYCFNDLLLVFVENGIIGGIILFFALCIILFSPNKNRTSFIIKTSLFTCLLFSFFSYSSHILDIKIIITLYIAHISTQHNKIFVLNLPIFPKRFSMIIYLLIISTFIPLIKTIQKYDVACRYWQKANIEYKSKNYEAAAEYNKKSHSYLKSNGSYLTFYGKTLFMSGEYDKAIKILDSAKKVFPNTIIYNTLGDIYTYRNEYAKAKDMYWVAWYMNPIRFYPKYKIAIIYKELNEITKAKNIAEELLTSKIKIESIAINDMKNELKKIIEIAN